MCDYTAASVVALIFFIVSVVYGESSSTICEVLVNIDSGPVCGRVEVAENSTKFYSFQGIPYAKPPVGARRFAELEPVDSWTESFYAYEEGPACPSRDLVYGSITVKRKGMKEDCIYANVFVPTTAILNSDEQSENSLLPILVNIHGGGFYAGSGNRDLHGPEFLMTKGVIVINFNYRLAVFGYLSLASDKIPGNNGLRDMVTLLKWVQRNARAFGGNPNHVTLLGNSAGGAAVNLLMLSSAAEGLFNRAIVSSGTGAIPSFFSASATYAKYVADAFLGALGINSTDTDAIHQTLTELPLEVIMKANDVVQYSTGLTSFVPVIEAEGHSYTRIVDNDPMTLMAQGRGKDIPLIIGFNENEAETFRWLLMMLGIVARYESNPAVVLSPRLAFELSTEDAVAKAQTIAERYFGREPTLDGYVKLVTEELFQYPSLKLAHWRTLLNSSSTYLYQFAYEGDFNIMKRAQWLSYNGTSHGDDFTYIFRCTSFLGDHVSFPPQTSDDSMRDWMSTLISNFVKCNTPTCSESDDSQWPPANKAQLMYQVIKEPYVYNMSALSDNYKSMVEFFDSVDDQVRTQSAALEALLCNTTTNHLLNYK